MDSILEKKSRNEIPVVLVQDLKKNNGENVTVKELDPDFYYGLRVQITRTYGRTYISSFDISDLTDKLEKLSETSKNSIFYVVAVKRKEASK